MNFTFRICYNSFVQHFRDLVQGSPFSYNKTTQELAIGFLCSWIFLSFRKTVITSSHNYKPVLVMFVLVSWIFMFKPMVLFCLFMFIFRYDICSYLENILVLEWSMQAKEQLWWNRKGFFKTQFTWKKKKNPRHILHLNIFLGTFSCVGLDRLSLSH